ncbi:MAG: hypothetical protein A2275_11885 [Bacteroidetes bacterium RIFOXYA12_FULL_35_11]|nr:MAG: hypothetical protein A2X01_21045 [Bacteroidetes bacterium GWF2_35_48]OFY81554.1 MAG: hypothetical protein A2275_11885 [Bacteroidetes bacterium RIFOXYA12_FULL_35_11]OFY94406.1 MAG: hypothetical protein A2491_00330 [Bacteroidetes bacterium RIFOXYC12_FULL_35_7]HBX50435.1 hypothetical protein [Bacteroidales bacterium]
MRRFLIIIQFLFFLSFNNVSAAAIQLSSDAEISILTCSPGEELYSVFGHSALRVFDPINRIDIVYNYGTFDFNTHNFYIKFFRGQLDYMLSVESFAGFKEQYVYDNRSVWEQVLNLSPTEKQAAFNLLVENARPENRNYRYDYFYDDCSTRIRDILQRALNGQIYFSDITDKKDKSFRELLDPYLTESQWTDLGMDLLLGLPSDMTASSDEYMFLPDFLMLAFDKAVHKTTKKPLVKSEITIYEAKKMQAAASGFLTPKLVFWVILVLVIIVSILLWPRNPVRYWFDFSYFLIFGLLGILLLLFWVATDHQAAAFNLNLLWAMPFHAIMAFFLIKKNKPRFVNFYFLGYSLLMLLLLISFKALPQGFNTSIIPIVITLCIRSFVIFWKENRD